MSNNGIITNNKPFSGPSFTFSNRLLRVLWGVVYALFFRPTPRPMHAWRRFLLRLFGARIGKYCNVYPRAKIWAPWNLYMEQYSSMANDVTCYSMATIHLGEKVVVSQGTHLCAGTHDYNDPEFPLYARPITVGARAWLCAESFVGPGVTIGEGAVVGARAVVTKSMPPWMICAGNPCEPLKPRVIKSSKDNQ